MNISYVLRFLGMGLCAGVFLMLAVEIIFIWAGEEPEEPMP